MVEGRDLSSRQTQDVAKDQEIGKPRNSATCSETAEGVAREGVKSCPRAGCGKSACPVRRALLCSRRCGRHRGDDRYSAVPALLLSLLSLLSLLLRLLSGLLLLPQPPPLPQTPLLPLVSLADSDQRWQARRRKAALLAP